MSRKLYEKPEDIANEKSVIQQVKEAWQLTEYHKLPRHYEYDYMISIEGHLPGIVEIKTRNNAHDAFDTYLISLHKVLTGLQYGHQFNMTPILVIKFTDGIYWTSLSQCIHWDLLAERYTILWGGRTKKSTKRDWQDAEPVLHIPMSMFHKLETGTAPLRGTFRSLEEEEIEAYVNPS